MTAKEQWEREIQQRHPVVTYYPKWFWPQVARFNGWLPFPPKS